MTTLQRDLFGYGFQMDQKYSQEHNLKFVYIFWPVGEDAENGSYVVRCSHPFGFKIEDVLSKLKEHFPSYVKNYKPVDVEVERGRGKINVKKYRR